MFARLAKFSDARRRHPMPVQATHARCNDNHRPDPRVAPASQRTKRQTLVCRWHLVPATARLECHWQIGSLDETSAEQSGESWLKRQVHRLLGQRFISAAAS
jgi:hypothetical protein